jgi:hypothetical protein
MLQEILVKIVLERQVISDTFLCLHHSISSRWPYFQASESCLTQSVGRVKSIDFLGKTFEILANKKQFNGLATFFGRMNGTSDMSELSENYINKSNNGPCGRRRR